jgi:hypothetical protein
MCGQKDFHVCGTFSANCAHILAEINTDDDIATIDTTTDEDIATLNTTTPKGQKEQPQPRHIV